MSNPYFSKLLSPADQKAEQLAARKQRALALIKQSQGIPQGSMVGGGGGGPFGERPSIYVAPDWTEQLAPALAGAIGNSQLDKIAKQEDANSDATVQQNKADWSDATANGAFDPVKASQSSDPELRRAALSWYANQPELEARKAEKEAARTYAEAKEAQRIAERGEDTTRQERQFQQGKDLQMEIHNDNKAETRAGRQFTVDNRAPPMNIYLPNGEGGYTIVNKRTDTPLGSLGGVTAPVTRPLNAGEQTAKTELAVEHDLIGQVRKELKANPDAVGFKQYMPSDVVQRAYPESVKTKAALTNLTSNIRHSRSGAAVTAAELPALDFLPRPTDTPQVIEDKLNSLDQNMQVHGLSFGNKGVAAPKPAAAPRYRLKAGANPDLKSSYEAY